MILIFFLASSLLFNNVSVEASYHEFDGPVASKMQDYIQDTESIYTLMASSNQELESTPRDMGNWDADSFSIIIDSATSRTITPYFSDLINPRPYESLLKGIGSGRITHVGTVRWKVLDVAGNEVILEDNEAYFSKEAPYRLLCPHSWRRYLNNKRYEAGETEGEGATMWLDPSDVGGYNLSWNRGRTIVDAPLDPQSNLPMVQGRSSYESFSAFASAFQCLPTIIPDDDYEYDELAENNTNYHDDDFSQEEDHHPQGTPREVMFSDEANINEPTIKIDDPVTYRDKALFLSWHIKLGHVPFQNIRWASKLGILPRKLSKCSNVVCPACMYGKQKRRPWRTKGSNREQTKIKKAMKSGECISVDQLISRTPGLVAQISGKLTTSQFKVATVFVDHYSDLDYVHVQESTSAEETIEAKRKFEKFMEERRVKVQHYHADNGIFASRAF